MINLSSHQWQEHRLLQMAVPGREQPQPEAERKAETAPRAANVLDHLTPEAAAAQFIAQADSDVDRARRNVEDAEKKSAELRLNTSRSSEK